MVLTKNYMGDIIRLPWEGGLWAGLEKVRVQLYPPKNYFFKINAILG